MRRALLMVVVAGCGAPLEEERTPVELTQGLRVKLGDGPLESAPRGVRLPLQVRGVGEDGAAFELDDEVWLPERGDLVGIKVSRRGVEFQFIDVSPPNGVQLDGDDVVNGSGELVLAYGGRELHPIGPGQRMPVDFARGDFVAIQLTEDRSPRVRFSTVHGLWLP